MREDDENVRTAIIDDVARAVRATAIVLTLCCWPACNASFPAAPTADPTVQRLRVLLESPQELFLNQTFSVIAYTVDSDTGYRNVTTAASWTSSDPAILQLVSSGRFRVAAVGSAQISAVYQGFTDALTLRTEVAVRPIPFLDMLRLPSLFLGDDAFVHTQFCSPGCQVVTSTATWASTDPTVATVSGGRITPLSIGTTQILAAYNGQGASFYVSVRPRFQ